MKKFTACRFLCGSVEYLHEDRFTGIEELDVFGQQLTAQYDSAISADIKFPSESLSNSLIVLRIWRAGLILLLRHDKNAHE